MSAMRWIALPIDADVCAPMYAHHFPGRPILPGAFLLDRIVAALTAQRALPVDGDWAVRSAKFLAPVGPADSLTLGWRGERDGIVRFECRAADTVVATGLLDAQPAR
ncbi:MAG TPA: hypothetical protein VM491_08475 [Burkholderiaceae bacterium]|nr:hypothetical protein [Burkholderiaceae bacterium]